MAATELTSTRRALAGVAAATAAPAAPTATEDPLLADKLRGMFSFNVTSLAGHAIGALVIETVFTSAPTSLRWGWGGAFAAVWAARVVLAWHLAGPLPTATPGLRRVRDAWIAGILAAAALWGWAGWSFFGHGNALQQIALIVVVYTFCVACIPILAPQFMLYLVFVALVDLPVIARVASPGTGLALQIALVMVIAMGMTIVLGGNYREAFVTLSRLQRKNLALVGELRAETAVAEAARGQAEIANRAKTQFFAAASHDLRQPLHAMGLFAEALRQRVSEPEVAQLVLSINESVDALEGLFSELLDITRIDSGGVEVKRLAFPMGPLLRRIRLHFEPAAFEKGLRLRLRGEVHTVLADPLLVERILRNLVANAIRYTADGTVLVSCRRRGATALLQVWDTGAGIARVDQERIFDEFYQLPTPPAATLDARKGLGLGLAIVKRLAGLLDAPLSLHSTPGRGSVFTLALPLGTPTLAGEPLALPAPTGGLLTLTGRRIVVVEDDPALRAALELLLAGWGANVKAFDGLAALRPWADRRDPALPCPDLAIVDHRLAEDATGLDAVRMLRERFGAAIPAIVVTGSLLSGVEPLAGAHELPDLHVLLKPVVPNKLRAMIAFKLGVRAAGR